MWYLDVTWLGCFPGVIPASSVSGPPGMPSSRISEIHPGNEDTPWSHLLQPPLSLPHLLSSAQTWALRAWMSCS